MLDQIKIKTLGRVFAAMLVAVTLAIVAVILFTRSEIDGVKETWRRFDTHTAAKADILSDLRATLGYGGIIHAFKNLVLRGDRLQIVRIQSHLQDIKVEMNAYETLGVNELEKRALAVIDATVARYAGHVAQVERLSVEGMAPRDIDRVVQIDDGPALAALVDLQRELTAARAKSARQVYAAVARIEGGATVVISLVVALLGLLVLVFLWFTHVRLLTPLRLMGESMQALADDDLEFPVPLLDRRDEVGDIARTLEVFKDNAVQRRQAERLLVDAQARYGGAMAIGRDAVISVDRDYRIELFSQGAERIFGHAAKEVIGQPLEILLPEAARPAHPGHLEAFLKSEEQSRVMGRRRQISGLRKDGSEFPAEASITKILLDDGVVFTVVLRDITERLEIEERLRRSQKLEAVGQLTGGVAHDFNNLLAIIQGNAELVADELGEDNPFARSIMRATTRGAELTQRLLAFSRAQPLQPKAIDMAELISGMSDLLQRTLGANIVIETRSPPELWTAAADPGQVENALLNLAINARDAMPSGGTLCIECRNARPSEEFLARNPDVEAGDYVVLTVRDTGDGMTAEVLERAVDPFFTTKEVGKGSGLGLSMVYGFARQSGGHLTIESEPGKGATIELHLPRDMDALEAERRQGDWAEPRGQGELILAIEDDEEVRALVVRLLDALGYRVIDVAEAADARAVLAGGEKIDLILSDVMLSGGMTGPEFAVEARRARPGLPVIFMSGYAAAAGLEKSLLGADGVLLTKPFQRHDLAKVMREALDHSRDPAIC